MSEPEFSIINQRNGPPYIAPDGSSHDEPWWEQPTPPEGFIPFSRITRCILQISGFMDRESCNLTAYLNAWIVREAMNTREGQHVQGELVANTRYDNYWRDQRQFGVTNRNFTAWNLSAQETAYVVGKLLDRRLPVRLTLPEELPNELQCGYAAVVSDPLHSRTVFSQIPGKLAVFDSKYPNATGIYALEDLARFQANPLQPPVVV